jgi:hypothetical protein
MPSPRLFALGVLVALGARPAASGAQSRVAPLEGPAAVADSFFRATRDARWVDAARLMDLDAISAMRDGTVRSARRQRPVPPMTAETFLQHDPKMPREVAEYQARQANERSTDVDPLANEYAGVPSVDSLARLPAVDVAARWLEARDVRWNVRVGLRASQKRGCFSADSIDAMIRAMRPGPARIIGTVIDDSLAYVLYERDIVENVARPSTEQARPRRRRARPSFVMPPLVMMLRRFGPQWRVVPSYDPGAAMLFGAELECPASSPRNDR